MKRNYWAQKTESRYSCMRSRPPLWMQCPLLLARLDARRETPNGSGAVSCSQALQKMHYLWKQAWSSDPTQIARKKANREVRRVQWTQDAINRNTLLPEISAASENDRRLFHKLVRKQRAQCNGCSALIVDGQMITDEDSVRANGLDTIRSYQPQSISVTSPRVHEDLEHLDPTEVSVTVDVVEEAIRKLNSNKAADRQGIAAEQFKLLPHRSIEILSELIQKIITERKLPDIMKRTYKIPIPKKDKDPRIQDNHHGITIAPILCKIIELICMKLGTNTTYQKMTYNLALP